MTNHSAIFNLIELLKYAQFRKANSKSKQIQAAFTLVELALALVIIGLLAGGILLGKDLIKAAENRAYVSQLQSYNAAERTFEIKYNCKAGDCANATALGLGTNGNGNGMVSGLTVQNAYPGDFNPNGDGQSGTSTFVVMYLNGAFIGAGESNYFWQHLASALLVPKDMKTLGVADGVGSSYHMPSAKNDGTGIVLTAWGGKHYFKSGVTSIRGGGNTIGSLNFSPADAAYIFEKMGGTTITTTNSHGSAYPDGLGKERVLVSDSAPDWCLSGSCYNTTFYQFQSQGTGGADADFCIDTSVTPAYFNVKNSKKLCTLIIQADF